LTQALGVVFGLSQTSSSFSGEGLVGFNEAGTPDHPITTSTLQFSIPLHP
jgi:hypothetical protein